MLLTGANLQPKTQATQITSPVLTTSKTITGVDFSQPITDPALAIQAQREALKSLSANTAVEAAARETQLAALQKVENLEQQETQVFQHASLFSTSAVIARQASDFAQASQEQQIKALATIENRDKLVNAVKYGVDMWRLQAHFTNIQIMGQTAIGVPGCLQGAALKPWILQAPGVYNATGYFRTLVTAVADAVDANFTQWKDGVSVPGLPWYPMFVAVAAPFAPPMPNIPMPLMVCYSQHFSKLASPSQIDTKIRSLLPNNFRLAEMDMFVYTLSAHLANYFLSWLSSQNVMMVMGMGPVPTFNPPYVPVGPVVNGYVIPSPGHLAA